MITQLKPISEFLGLITHVDPSQVPLGGAISCKNMAQLSTGRLRRIPGIVAASSPATDAQVRIPLAFWAKGLGAGGVDQLIAIYIGVSVVSVVNLTAGLVMTGPALTSPAFDLQWTATFYNNLWMFAGGGNTSIYKLDSASVYSAVTGTPPPPGGNLIKSFLNRLYVADIAGSEGIVQYSDVLTTNFPATNLINVKEIPGKITALAVNSPSTDSAGIGTQLVIAKHTAIWVWDELSKDLVSSAIGFASTNSIVNTEAGLIGLGHKGTRHSVFFLPLGTAGEPVDIGESLVDILNGTTVLVSEHLTHAVLHDRFYKLFFSLTGQNDNPNEVWLDTYLLSTERKTVWYGVHGRGKFDASTVVDSTLELFSRGTPAAGKRFQENTNTTNAFVDSSGNILIAVLDMPLNVEPPNEQKVFNILELQIAKEANTSGNSITFEPISEGTSYGIQNISIYDGRSQGSSRVTIPVRATGYTGLTGRDVRVKLTHSLGARFDILAADVQYLVNEGRSHVRKQN